MRFSHNELRGSLEWGEKDYLNELVVESPVFLRKVLRGLSAQNDDLGVHFTKHGEPMNFSKEIDVIYNPLRLDFNNRRAIATLLKILVKASKSEEFYLENNEFNTRVVRHLDKLIDSENFAFEVSAGEFAIDDIAKAVNLHIVDDEDDFVELLTDYMSMMAELASIKLFVFLNLRAILLDEELERLLKNLRNHELKVLLIEGRALAKIGECGRILVDADLCEV